LGSGNVPYNLLIRFCQKSVKEQQFCSVLFS